MEKFANYLWRKVNWFVVLTENPNQFHELVIARCCSLWLYCKCYKLILKYVWWQTNYTKPSQAKYIRFSGQFVDYLVQNAAENWVSGISLCTSCPSGRRRINPTAQYYCQIYLSAKTRVCESRFLFTDNLTWE